MKEAYKTAALGAVALVLAVSAAMVEPESRVPEILSDQGQPFYPHFTDANAPHHRGGGLR